MKKILLFPYHPDIDLLMAQSSKKFQTIGIYSYKEDELVTAPLNEKLGSSGNFDEMLKECDQLVLLENYRKCKTEKYYEVIEKALLADTHILLMPQLKQELNLKPYEGYYTILESPSNHKYLSESQKLYQRERYKIEVPVIAVFGMGKHCNKFDNQLLLKNTLDEEGYHTVWLSSNPLGALFGGTTMPEFLYDENLSFERKVFALNHFLYQIALDKKPDVFIIGVPEGISEFEMHEYHHFSEYPLIVGSAVSIDSAVFCTYFMKTPDTQGIAQVANHSLERFQFPIRMISIGKSAFETIQGKNEIVFSYLSNDYVKRHFSPVDTLPDFISPIWESEKNKMAIKNLLAQLCANADTI